MLQNRTDKLTSVDPNEAHGISLDAKSPMRSSRIGLVLISRPVFTNPVHLDVKPANRNYSLCRLVGSDQAMERVVSIKRGSRNLASDTLSISKGFPNLQLPI